MADTVFGVFVWFLNVTIFAEPIDQAPVKVQTRKVLPPPTPCRRGPTPKGFWSLDPASTFRTTFAIRSAAGRVKLTCSVRAGLPSGFGE
jgi:hypothetical protein